METFPTGGDWIIDGGFKNTRVGNPTQESTFYAGYSQRTNRITWVPKVFGRNLVNLTTAQMNTLDTFETTVKFGQSAFNWTDPLTSTVYEVRLDPSVIPLSFSPHGNMSDKWQVKLAFIQTTPAELTDSWAKDGVMKYQVENLAAGSDITSRPIFTRAYDWDFSKASILTQGTPAGIDNANTVVITLKNGAGTTIVSKTYNTANQPPTNDASDLGALSVTNIDGLDIVTLTATCGATADMPLFSIVLE